MTTPGRYGAATEAAVRSFQEARGIRVDGICGPETWAALVESGFALGDRLLYERSPNLRGDDVAELQRRLNALGFDAGREDGILGHQTAAALREFQRNTGGSVDGILGPETLRSLSRVGSLTEGSVAAVREREQLRHPRRLVDHRVYVAVGARVPDARRRRRSSACPATGAQTITDLSGEDDSTIAQRANQYRADLFVGVRAGDRSGCRCHYFASGDFRSEGGFRVATAIQGELDAVLGPDRGRRAVRADASRSCARPGWPRSSASRSVRTTSRRWARSSPRSPTSAPRSRAGSSAGSKSSPPRRRAPEPRLARAGYSVMIL